MRNIQRMLEEKIKKAEWLPKSFNRNFNESVFLECIDKIYLLHYLCLQEVCYMCDMIEQKEISQTFHVIFGGMRYIFESLTDSYLRKSEELLEIKNSTNVRYIEHPDNALKLEMTVAEMTAARNKRALELEEEDKKRAQQEKSGGLFGSSGGLFGFKGRKQNNKFNLNFADSEELIERELREKQKIEEAVVEIRKDMEKGLPIDYYAIQDPRIILELNNQVFSQMINESHKQQEKLRRTIVEYEGFNNLDLKTPGELHRLILMNTRIVENLQFSRFELSMADVGAETDKNFKEAETELYKTFNEKQRELMMKVVDAVKRRYEKPKEDKCFVTITTSKDIDSLWLSSTINADSKEAKKELLAAKAENDKLMSRMSKLKEEFTDLQKHLLNKEKLIFGLMDNIEQLKKIQKQKLPSKTDISHDISTDKIPLPNPKLETELAQLTEKLKTYQNQVASLEKDLESTKKRSEGMYQALDQARRLASKHGVLRVGSMSDLQVIMKIEQMLTSFEENFNKIEEENENKGLVDSFYLDVGNGKKVKKPVKMKHVVIDATGRNYSKIAIPEEGTQHDKDTLESKSAFKSVPRLPPYHSLQSPTDSLQNFEVKPRELKVSVVTIAIIHPRKNTASIFPPSNATTSQITMLAAASIGQGENHPTKDTASKQTKGDKSSVKNSLSRPSITAKKQPANQKVVDKSLDRTGKSKILPAAVVTTDRKSDSKDAPQGNTGDLKLNSSEEAANDGNDKIQTEVNQAAVDIPLSSNLLSERQLQRPIQKNEVEPQHKKQNKDKTKIDYDFQDLEKIMRSLKENGETLIVKCLLSKLKATIVNESSSPLVQELLPNSNSKPNSRQTSKDVGRTEVEKKSAQNVNTSIQLPTISEIGRSQPQSYSKFIENRAKRNPILLENKIGGLQQKKLTESMISQHNSAKYSIPTTTAALALDSEERIGNPPRSFQEVATDRQHSRALIKYHKRNISNHISILPEETEQQLRRTQSQIMASQNQSINDMRDREPQHFLSHHQSMVTVFTNDQDSKFNHPKNIASLDGSGLADDYPQNNCSVISNSQIGSLPVEYKVYVPVQYESIPDTFNILVANNHENEELLEMLYTGNHLENSGGAKKMNFAAVGKSMAIPTFQHFKKEIKRFVEQHAKCGPECVHLKRFYERCGVAYVPKSIGPNKQPYIFPLVDMIKKVPRSELEKDVVLRDQKTRRKEEILKNLASKPVFI